MTESIYMAELINKMLIQACTDRNNIPVIVRDSNGEPYDIICVEFEKDTNCIYLTVEKM